MRSVTLEQSLFLHSSFFFFFLEIYLEIKMFTLVTEVIKKKGVLKSWLKN